jgi:hypothetical protein
MVTRAHPTYAKKNLQLGCFCATSEAQKDVRIKYDRVAGDFPV